MEKNLLKDLEKASEKSPEKKKSQKISTSERTEEEIQKDTDIMLNGAKENYEVLKYGKLPEGIMVFTIII